MLTKARVGACMGIMVGAKPAVEEIIESAIVIWLLRSESEEGTRNVSSRYECGGRRACLHVRVSSSDCKCSK